MFQKQIQWKIWRDRVASLQTKWLKLLVLCSLLINMVNAAAYSQQNRRPEFASSEILVKFNQNANKRQIANFNSGQRTSALNANKVLGYTRLRVPKGTTVQQMVQRYRQNPDVGWAEPNYKVHADVLPNDPRYASNQQAYYNLISAESAWNIETGNANIIIAVLDTGVDLDHPDLAANIWTNSGEIANNEVDDDGNGYVDDINGYDFVGVDPGDSTSSDQYPDDANPDVFAPDSSTGNGLDDDNNGTADDGVTHGTMVAGVAGAVGNNGIGVAGASWHCSIMAVRVLNPEGYGYISDVADGITYAALNGANIINLSLSSSVDSSTINAAIDFAHDTKGAIIVAAAGNSNTSMPEFPAANPKTIAVGASDKADGSAPFGRAYFSNWGSHIDVVAPGVSIHSTGVYSVAQGTPGAADYFTKSGTSFSAPLVAGLAALVLSKNPAYTNEQVRVLIKDAALDLPDDPNAGTDWDGAGLVQFSRTDSLPVELSSFSVVTVNRMVNLNWRTESEVNNFGFIIYRSETKDGEYKEIGRKDGAGNSAMPTDYQFIDKEAEAGKTYFYYLEDIDITGKRNTSQIIKVVVLSAKHVPKEFRLLQNYPNPFNPETWLPYKLANSANITIHIYNIKGEAIHTINLGTKNAGTYTTKNKAALWNGRTQTDEPASSGIYFYQIKACPVSNGTGTGNFTATRKMILLK